MPKPVPIEVDESAVDDASMSVDEEEGAELLTAIESYSRTPTPMDGADDDAGGSGDDGEDEDDSVSEDDEPAAGAEDDEDTGSGSESEAEPEAEGGEGPALEGPASASASSSASASPGVLADEHAVVADIVIADVKVNGDAGPSGPLTLKRPKKQRRARTRSPSPVPLPPAPLATYRLDIPLGGPENYEVNIIDLAKVTGQRPTTPPPIKLAETSDSEAQGDEEGSGRDKAQPEDKPKPKRRRKSDWYDLEDAFIDDTDLAIDERSHFAQTKQQGFYVSSGEVALRLEQPSPRKPRSRSSKKLDLLAISQSISSGSTLKSRHSSNPQPPHVIASGTLQPIAPRGSEVGTREKPIALSDNEDNGSATGAKRKIGLISGLDGIKLEDDSDRASKKRRPQIHPFGPELQAALDDLTAALKKVEWPPRGKFPQEIKPLLLHVAIIAIENNEYDDNFFNLMPRMFPYNRFTMAKLIKRTVFADHIKILTRRQDELLVRLKKVADEGFDRAKDEHDRAVVAWERRQEKSRPDGEGGPAPLTHTHSGTGSVSHEGTPTPSHAAPRETTPTPGVDGPNGQGAGATKPPPVRYKLTDEMKGILWALVCLSNECVRIENEKNDLEGTKKDVSEQGMRKSLYVKIVAAFPDGWMSSQQISREVSILKKKAEKEAMEVDG